MENQPKDNTPLIDTPSSSNLNPSTNYTPITPLSIPTTSPSPQLSTKLNSSSKNGNFESKPQMDYQINVYKEKDYEMNSNHFENIYQPPSTSQSTSSTSSSSKCTKFLEIRYQIVFLSFIVILISYADRTNISTAIVEMKESYGWTDTEVGMILSAFYYGYTFNQIPGSYIARKVGGQRTLFFALAFWSFFTIITPFTVNNFTLLILCRVLMGASEGITFPAVHQLISKWVPKVEQSRAVSIVTAGCYIGTVVAMFITPLIITKYGWQMVFYIFGVVGGLWCFPILSFKTDGLLCLPHFVSSEISHEISPSLVEKNKDPIPWLKFLFCKQLWAIVINQWCNSWGFYVILNWIPSYYKEIMNVELGDQGVLLMMPFFVQGFSSYPFGWLADYLISKHYSIILVRRGMQMVGMIFPAFFVFLFMLFPNSKIMAMTCLVFALGFNSCTLSGVSVYQHDIAPQYAGILFAIGNTAGNLPGIVAVYLTGWLLDRTDNWNLIFWIAIIFYLIGAIAWYFLAVGETPLKSLLTPSQLNDLTLNLHHRNNENVNINDREDDGDDDHNDHRDRDISLDIFEQKK